MSYRPPRLTFTVDLEDPTDRYAADGRYVAMAQHILDLCDQTGRKATFFTVGKVAEAAPDLIRAIASRGHEVAWHSHDHRSLTDDTPDRFRRHCREDRDRIAQLTGQKVVGFRAPRFSLTPDSAWTLDCLKEAGFLYSSSIMPTSLSRFGFPTAATAPFRWPNGLVEFPLPVASLAGTRLPYLGGIYLYAMPMPILRRLLARAVPDDVLWTYTHPYDFDRAEPFAPMPHTPLWVSAVLWLARLRAEPQLRRVLALCEAAPPLRDRLGECVAQDVND